MDTRVCSKCQKTLALDGFYLTDKEQFLKACNYVNLQPLWYEEHLLKSRDEGSGY